MLKKEIRNTLFAKIKAIKHWDNEHLCFPDQNIYVLDVSVRDSDSLTSTNQGRKLEVPAGQRSTGCAFRSEPDMSQGFAMQCQPGASANLVRSLNNNKPGWEEDGCRGEVAGQVRSNSAGSSVQPTHHAALPCCLGDSSESLVPAVWKDFCYLQIPSPIQLPCAEAIAMKGEARGTGIVHRAPSGVTE